MVWIVALLLRWIPSSYCSEYRYLGCYEDFQDRVLGNHYLTSIFSMTNLYCYDHCQKHGRYKYFGTEVGTECHCGNSNDRFVRKPGECTSPCSGNLFQKCGNHWRLSVYEIISEISEKGIESSPPETGVKLRTNSSCTPEYNCVCPSGRINTETTSEQIASTIETLKFVLSINKKNTTTYKRSKISSRDDRLSSKSMGIVAIIIILLPVMLAVINDLLKCFH